MTKIMFLHSFATGEIRSAFLTVGNVQLLSDLPLHDGAKEQL
jgi:hypothetical protein